MARQQQTNIVADSKSVLRTAAAKAPVPGSTGEIDLEADARQPKAKPEELAAIINLARTMYRLQKELESMAAEADRKMKELEQLQAVTLPERMQAAGMKDFTLDNGYKVEVADFIRASIPSQGAIDKATGPDKDLLIKQRKDAHAWLRAHKAGDLIKNKLTADFGKGQSKEAQRFFKLIEKAGYPAKCEESVNFQSLNAFIRECLKDGIAVPDKTFSLFNGKRAELIEPKKEKDSSKK